MYEDKIRKYHPLTIEHIIQMAEADLPLKYRSMPWTYQDEAGRNLERGSAILETEELCSAYMAAYGRMHCHKLNYALDKSQGKGNFPYGEVRNGVEIFDWGCARTRLFGCY